MSLYFLCAAVVGLFLLMQVNEQLACSEGPNRLAVRERKRERRCRAGSKLFVHPHVGWM